MHSIFLVIKIKIKNLLVIIFPFKQDKIFKQYFDDGGDEKFRYDFDLNSNSIIFDLGGYKGQWASDIYAKYNSRILVFEPVNLFADKILNRFKKNPKIEVYSIALGANNRSETISVGEDGTSLYKKYSNLNAVIQFEDAYQFIKKKNIVNIDLMKINIEGGEYELLPRLIETGYIQNIKQLQIQFHDILPDSLIRMNSIQNNLALTHVKTFSYEFVWDNWILKTDII
jgi:FkbM family methyltransferase